VKFRKTEEEEKEEINQEAEVASVVATEATWLHTRIVLRISMILLVIAGSLWVTYKLEGVILLLILSIFFAYLVAPLVELVRSPFNFRGREYTIPRAIAIGIVYLLLFSAIIIALWLLLPKLSKQIKDFSATSTQFQTTAEGRVKAISDFCHRNELSDNACDVINDRLTKGINAAKEYIATDLPNLIGYILSFVPWLILIPILSFFFLKDVDAFRRSALQMFPRGRWRWRADEFFQDVNSTLAAYIRAQLTACLLIGIICTLGFVLLGVPFPLVLGVIAGLFEFIPLVGPLVVAIIAFLVTSFSPDTSTYSALWVLLFLGVLRIVHDYTIYPRLISQGVHLHPLAVILAILCGAELAGVVGIFLSIPVTAIATVSYRHWLEHKGSEGLVAEILQPGSESAVTPEAGEAAHAAYPEEHTHDHENHSYPTIDTTADEMTRARPDLTTGELKRPVGMPDLD
jgi:predicted PurR-regulated permease PerM